MFQRTLINVLLLVSLLCAGLVAPAAGVINRSGACVEAPCMQSCCQAMTCCHSSQPQEAPRLPESAAAKTELQIAPPIFQRAATLLIPPPRVRNLFRVEKESGGHAPPPLARSCIQLI